MSKEQYTRKQVMDLVHGAYDQLEAVSRASLEKVLKERLGFGPKRTADFMEAFMMQFGEEAVAVAEQIKAEARKRQR